MTYQNGILNHHDYRTFARCVINPAHSSLSVFRVPSTHACVVDRLHERNTKVVHFCAILQDTYVTMNETLKRMTECHLKARHTSSSDHTSQLDARFGFSEKNPGVVWELYNTDRARRDLIREAMRVAGYLLGKTYGPIYGPALGKKYGPEGGCANERYFAARDTRYQLL
jgi:hypothetical protein